MVRSGRKEENRVKIRIFLTLVFVSFRFSMWAQLSPVAQDIVSCGAGIFTLEAISPTPGVTYKWFDASNQLIEDVTGPVYTTEEIINTTFFQVVAVLNTVESAPTVINITIENTADIFEGTIVGLCGGNVTLNSGVSFIDMSNLSFQWQSFETTGSGQPSSGDFVDISMADGGTAGLSITVSREGFYRIIVTDENTGCRVISESIQVVFLAPYDSEILGSDTFCYPSGGQTITVGTEVPTAVYIWEVSEDNINFNEVTRGPGETELTIMQSDFPGLALGDPTDELFYRLTIEVQNCTVASDVLQVTAREKPTIGITRQSDGLTDDFVFCGTDPINERTLVAAYDAVMFPDVTLQWQRAFIPGLFNDIGGASNTTLTLQSEEEGEYRIKITNNIDGCENFSNVIFAETAQSSFSGANSFCEGQTIVLTAIEQSMDAVFQWSTSESAAGPFTPLPGEMNSSLIISPAFGFFDDLFFRLTVNVNGCVVQSEVEIAQFTVPTAAITAPETVICLSASETVELSVDGIEPGTDYLWLVQSMAGVVPAPGVNNGTSYTVNTPATYFLRASNPGNATCSDEASIVIMPSFDFDTNIMVDMSADLCEATVFSVQEVAGINYQWIFSPDATTYQPLAETDFDLLAEQAGFYAVIFENSQGCQAFSDTVNLIANVSPLINISEAFICGNASNAALTTPELTGANYLWFFSADNTVFSEAPDLNDRHQYITSTEGFYQVEISIATCSRTSSPIEVREINSFENFSAAIDGSNALCIPVDESTELRSIYTSETATYEWSFSSDGSEFTTLENQVQSTLSVNAADFVTQSGEFTQRIYRLVVADGSCVSASLPHLITAREVPTISISRLSNGSSEGFFFCGDDPLNSRTLVVNETQLLASRFQWQVFNGETFEDLVGANDTRLVLGTGDLGTYRCVVTNEIDGCSSVSNMVTAETALVVINDFENGISDGTIRFCEEEDILVTTFRQINGIALTGYTYQWLFSSDSTNFDVLPDQQSDSLLLTVEDALYGSGLYVVNAIKNGCLSSDTTTVIFEQSLPPDEIEADFPGICEGSNRAIELSHTEPNELFIYQWEVLSEQGQYVAAPGGAVNSSFFTLNPGTFRLRISNGFCESISNEVMLEIFPNVDLLIEEGLNILSREGEAVQVTATGADSYFWEPSEIFNDPEIPDPVVFVPPNIEENTLELTLVGENSFGCRDSLEVVIFLEETGDISVSKIVTPNGDRINDTLEIVNIEEFPNNRVTVYDRRGKVIFSTTNFDNNSSELREMSANLQDGVYYYKIDLGDSDTVDGNFLVIR